MGGKLLARAVGLVGLALAAGGLTGCEMSDPPATRNNLNDGASAAVDTADTGGGECGCLKPGLWFRFEKLTLDSIDLGKHNVQLALNPLWKKDIETFELNFYAHVKAVTATEVTIEIVNGARVAGSTDVCLLPYTKVEVVNPRKGCALDKSAPTAMNVYAGTPANPKNCAPKNEVKHSIPVRGAVLEAVVNADCTRMDQGIVSAGHLPKAALDITCTCLATGNQTSETCGVPEAGYVDGKGCDGCNSKFQNLNTLLNNFGTLEYKCKEGGLPAACLTASFWGGIVAGPPPVCPGF